jgi:hypothetical protein
VFAFFYFIGVQVFLVFIQRKKRKKERNNFISFYYYFFFVRREFKRMDFLGKIIHVIKMCSLSGELGESSTFTYTKMNYCAPHLSLLSYQCKQ